MRLFHDAQVVVLPHLEATQSGVAAFALGMGRAVVALEHRCNPGARRCE